jgi:hypothetical protein
MGLGIGNTTALGQVQELQEAAAVQQLILERVVGQVVELLQHQDLHHQQGWIRRATAFGARWPRCGGINGGGQRLEVHMLGQTNQRISDLGTAVFAFVFCKQADPGLHHAGTHLAGSMSEFYRTGAPLPEVSRGALKCQQGPLLHVRHRKCREEGSELLSSTIVLINQSRELNCTFCRLL